MTNSRKKKYQRIGQALHVSPSSGNLILKVTENVHIGDKVYAKNGKEIGWIYDVFGSVKNPYISVTLKKNITKIVGETIFRKH